jgi:hypothetical protein
MSVLISDVRETFEYLVKVGRHLLKDGEQFALQEGSQTNGRAFRLFITGGEIGSGMSGAPLTQDRGYLGWTKREAYTELHKLISLYSK